MRGHDNTRSVSKHKWRPLLVSKGIVEKWGRTFALSRKHSHLVPDRWKSHGITKHMCGYRRVNWWRAKEEIRGITSKYSCVSQLKYYGSVRSGGKKEETDLTGDCQCMESGPGGSTVTIEHIPEVMYMSYHTNEHQLHYLREDASPMPKENGDRKISWILGIPARFSTARVQPLNTSSSVKGP